MRYFVERFPILTVIPFCHLSSDAFRKKKKEERKSQRKKGIITGKGEDMGSIEIYGKKKDLVKINSREGLKIWKSESRKFKSLLAGKSEMSQLERGRDGGGQRNRQRRMRQFPRSCRLICIILNLLAAPVLISVLQEGPNPATASVVRLIDSQRKNASRPLRKSSSFRPIQTPEIFAKFRRNR